MDASPVKEESLSEEPEYRAVRQWWSKLNCNKLIIQCSPYLMILRNHDKNWHVPKEYKTCLVLNSWLQGTFSRKLRKKNTYMYLKTVHLEISPTVGFWWITATTLTQAIGSGPTMTIVVFGIAAKADAMTNLIIWLITSRQSSWRIMSIAPDRESREFCVHTYWPTTRTRGNSAPLWNGTQSESRIPEAC